MVRNFGEPETCWAVIPKKQEIAEHLCPTVNGVLKYSVRGRMSTQNRDVSAGMAVEMFLCLTHAENMRKRGYLVTRVTL